MALPVFLSIPTFSYSVPTRQRSRVFPALWKKASSSSFFSMTDMATYVLLIGRMDHALFSDDRRNQILCGNVEGWIEYPSAFRRERSTKNVRYFFWVPLFDGNILSRSALEIDGGSRPCHIEWNSMPLRQHGDAVGSDLVRHVAIGGNPVTTHDHSIDLAFLHQIPRHIVRYQGSANFILLKLPGGQTGALKKRPRLIDPYFNLLPGLLQGANDAEGCSITCRRQRAGIAVCHDLPGIG